MSSEDKILKLIGIESSSEPKAEVLDYLQKLRAYKIDTLKKDAAHLKDQAINLEQDTIQLAYGNYAAFIQTAESSRGVLKGWNETTKNVEGLTDVLPKFSQKCDEFVKSTLDIQSASRLNSLTMKKHVELLEILELPQLMESSIQDQKYEDALELASYVQKLGAKFDNISVVNSIVKAIELSWHVMISQLLSDLKYDLTLPRCLQIVGYLRRMQAFSTPELKMKFLQTRDCWFKSQTVIPKTDGLAVGHQNLTKAIEMTRVHLFNIVTQYKALFEDDFNKGPNSKMNLIFNSWVNEKIEEFLRMLENGLENGLTLCNNSLMEICSIMGQCMYFGVSFSRIGFDFRAQLAPIFIKTFTKYLNTALIKATKKFEMDMEHFTLINRDIATFKRVAKPEEPSENEDKHSNAPPESLLDFQPLAVYCNALLNIFNELRSCSPTAIVQPFVLALEASLESVTRSILNFYKSEQQAFDTREKDNFLKMCSCFAFELLPYVQLCINLIFTPNSKLFCNITTLRSEKILESFQHLPVA